MLPAVCTAQRGEWETVDTILSRQLDQSGSHTPNMDASRVL
jgi:hypothetical protein